MMNKELIDRAIEHQFVLNLTLRIKRDDYREESDIIDKIGSKALDLSGALNMPCGDAVWNQGGPAHDPYLQAWSSDREVLHELGCAVVAYGKRFKGVTWEAM